MNHRRTKTISITSGKGGVGKSSTVANLALTMGRRGYRVLLLDGDLGMANLDIMFGARSQGTIQDVVNGDKTLDEVIIQVAENVYLIPGGSGIYGMSRLDVFQRQSLLDQVSDLDRQFDFMLIDTAPGIDDNVLYLNTAAQEIVVVVNSDPSSLTDSYALIKVLHQRHQESRFSILPNMVKDENEAMAIYRRLSDVANKFLYVSLDLKGYIPMDLNLRQATQQQQLVVQAYPNSASSLAFKKLSEKLGGFGVAPELKGSIQFFWQQLSGVA